MTLEDNVSRPFFERPGSAPTPQEADRLNERGRIGAPEVHAMHAAEQLRNVETITRMYVRECEEAPNFDQSQALADHPVIAQFKLPDLSSLFMKALKTGAPRSRLYALARHYLDKLDNLDEQAEERY